MTYWRNPEIEAVLGGPLDESGLNEESVLKLIETSTRESEVLDFKSSEYQKTVGKPEGRWTNEQEFAKDVASFANKRGGLILIGVEEEAGVATGLQPLTTTTAEREEQRLRAALLNFTAPFVELQFVGVSCASGGFVLVVVIPPSDRGPHAVLSDRGNAKRPMMFPLRDGADTAWLNESEVAERYRRRFLAQSDHDSRTNEVLADGQTSLRSSPALWMFMAIIPEGPAFGRLDSATVRRTSEWFYSNLILTPFNSELLTGGTGGIAAPGRVTFTGRPYRDEHDPDNPYDAFAALYVDGCAYTATIVDENATTPRYLSIDQIVDETIKLGDLCLRWAAETRGAWGLATAVIGFADANSIEEPFTKALELGSWRYTDTGKRRSGTRAVQGKLRSRITIDLGSTGSLQERLVYIRAAASVVLQQFGIPEAEQIRPDGSLNGQAWPTDRYRLAERWAKDNGVPFA